MLKIISESERNHMKKAKQLKKEWITEMKAMQGSSQGEISPADLSFDLAAELGELGRWN